MGTITTYIDDLMVICLQRYIQSEMQTADTLYNGLLGAGAVAVNKDVQQGQRIDNIGDIVLTISAQSSG